MQANKAKTSLTDLPQNLTQKETVDTPSQGIALPRLYDEREAASYLRKSVAWMQRARWRGSGPRYLKLGRHVRYTDRHISEYLELNTVETDQEH